MREARLRVKGTPQASLVAFCSENPDRSHRNLWHRPSNRPRPKKPYAEGDPSFVTVQRLLPMFPIEGSLGLAAGTMFAPNQPLLGIRGRRGLRWLGVKDGKENVL